MDTRWYHYGKEARAQGRPRELKDGRVSPLNRAAYQRGWDDQNNLTKPPPSAAQVQEAKDVKARLQVFVQQLEAKPEAPEPERKKFEESHTYRIVKSEKLAPAYPPDETRTVVAEGLAYAKARRDLLHLEEEERQRNPRASSWTCAIFLIELEDVAGQ